jgi:hypothetical protein
MDSFLEKYTRDGNPIGIRVGWRKHEMIARGDEAVVYGYVNPHAFYSDAMREMSDVIRAEINKMVDENNELLDSYTKFEILEKFKSLGYKELKSQYETLTIRTEEYVVNVSNESLAMGERFVSFMMKLKSLGYVH